MPLIMKKIKNIVWDWNGTLLDDAYICVEILNSMLVEYNALPITHTFYEDTFGFPLKDFYETIGSRMRVKNNTYELLGRRFLFEYENKKHKASLRKGAVELLNKLKKGNYSLFILSAYQQKYLDSILTHYGIRKVFKHVSGLNSFHEDSKIENGVKLSKDFKLSKEDSIFIGDTLHDKETANAMKIPCWLVYSKHTSRKRLKQHIDETTRFFNDLQEIEAELELL